MRTDGRNNNELRNVKIIPNYIPHAEGSVMIEMGDTHLVCTASVEDKTPKWLQGTKKGWVTAEYGMLPRSTFQRMRRDKVATGGRTQEISRLIGRGLRAAINLEELGERSIHIDCDVIKADGGTRTAAVTGGFVALYLALSFLKDQGKIKTIPVTHFVSAISVGLNKDTALLDLNYDEDSTIDTDMNFIMNEKNEFIEIQGTAEGATFNTDHLNSMMELAKKGCAELVEIQKKVVGFS